MGGDDGIGVVRFRIDNAPHYNPDHDTLDNDWAVDLRRSVLACDCIVLSSPSFNSNVPSTVKALGESALAGKRLAVIPASPGPGAGMPAAEYITKLAGFMKAVIVRPAPTSVDRLRSSTWNRVCSENRRERRSPRRSTRFSPT